jgi:death-on-curing protein
MALFGGPHWVPDIGLRESALAKPVNRFAYGKPDLSTLAAPYGFAIAKNPSIR